MALMGVHHFLVEPTEPAIRHFSANAGDFACLLLEPMLLDPTGTDKLPLMQLAKLVYLARIREYTPFNSQLDAIAILGSDQISLDIFDRWWTIRTVEYEFSFETMAKLYLNPLSSKISSDDIHYLKWLRGAA